MVDRPEITSVKLVGISSSVAPDHTRCWHDTDKTVAKRRQTAGMSADPQLR